VGGDSLRIVRGARAVRDLCLGSISGLALEREARHQSAPLDGDSVAASGLFEDDEFGYCEVPTILLRNDAVLEVRGRTMCRLGRFDTSDRRPPIATLPMSSDHTSGLARQRTGADRSTRIARAEENT
jgi:hypothetical protein